MKKIIVDTIIDGEETKIFVIEDNKKVIILDYSNIKNMEEFKKISSLEDIKDFQNEIINKGNMSLEQHLKNWIKKWNDYDDYENRKIISMKESK